MNKKILLIGVLLVIASFAAGAIGANSSISSIINEGNASTKQLIISGNSVVYSQIPVNSPSFVSISYTSTNMLDFYLVNGSAFAALQPYLSSNAGLEGAAEQYEGRGVIAILLNSSSGLLPYQGSYQSLFPRPAYYSNFSLLGNGTYYSVFQNTKNLSQTISYKLFSIPIARLNSGAQLLGISQATLFTSAVLFIAGVGLVAYSFLSKKADNDQKEKSIQAMYQRIGGKTAVRSRKRRGKTGRGHRQR